MSFAKGMLVGGAIVLATAAIMGTARAPSKVLDVERINIREADGTLRMVIAGRDKFPGSFVKGKEIPRPDRTAFAGLLLLNDEGTENGGMIWKGLKGPNGEVDAGASLTFDRYGNDQTLQLLQTDSGTHDTSALIFSDRPAGQLNSELALKAEKAPTEEERSRLMAQANVGGAPRMFVGRSRDRNSIIMMQDEKGAPRLIFNVSAKGEASIVFLNEQGQPVRTITPTSEVAPAGSTAN
jgi:hypothetical protein